MATLSLTIPDDLLPIYLRFQAENGPAWADSYLTDKLRELRDRFAATDMRGRDAKFQQLPPGKRQQVQDVLDGKA